MDNMKMAERYVQAIGAALDRVAEAEDIAPRQLCVVAAGVAILGLEDMGCAEGIDHLLEILLIARSEMTGCVNPFEELEEMAKGQGRGEA